MHSHAHSTYVVHDARMHVLRYENVEKQMIHNGHVSVPYRKQPLNGALTGVSQVARYGFVKIVFPSICLLQRYSRRQGKRSACEHETSSKETTCNIASAS